jgi:hypothetical protein
MAPDDLKSFRFRACRDLYGGVRQIGAGRRNGRPAIFLPPGIAEPIALPDPSPALWAQERLFVNLTPIERETWRKILQARSIASVAKEKGVSRAAIYARIEGDCKGRGGMVAKNYWVLLWWLLRQRSLFREHHD